ncbi:fumarylacetoacetate hydrolase family protein [Rhodobacteraceae bacterium D3-12]|nr:fumarylacetoacetate hydrolase family protein [Rhodobacteraceae bacterium D3-12]
MTMLDYTHDQAATSWVQVPAGNDFPIQNLPLGIVKPKDGKARVVVAIGDQVLDLAKLADMGPFDGLAGQALNLCRHEHLNPLAAAGVAHRRALRLALFGILSAEAPRSMVNQVRECLRPAVQNEYLLPFEIGDYTDFYASLDHAINVGRAFHTDYTLPSNFTHMPIAYHGRASTVRVSGTSIARPIGQHAPQGGAAPVLAPSTALDFELEVGVFIGTGNVPDIPIPISAAREAIFGLCLLNDWSARDLQVWESRPLGPFLSKSFATTVSPWVVTPEALAPFRCEISRPTGFPGPPEYRKSPGLDST